MYFTFNVAWNVRDDLVVFESPGLPRQLDALRSSEGGSAPNFVPETRSLLRARRRGRALIRNHRAVRDDAGSVGLQVLTDL
jgi:hypothetical protein